MNKEKTQKCLISNTYVVVLLDVFKNDVLEL